jgi:hypothetical protein
MNRIYIMPLADLGPVFGRGPKYWQTYFPSLQWAMIDYGPEQVAVVRIPNVDTPTHQALALLSDVISPPEDLGQQIGAQLTQVKNALEAFNIPADWVQASHTYAQGLRLIACMFCFAQKMVALGATRVFPSGVTLATRFNQLTTAQKNFLLNTAIVLNFNTSILTGNSTMRQILKAMADQWGLRSIFVGGCEL